MLTSMVGADCLSCDVQHVHFADCVYVFYYLLHASCFRFRITNGVGRFDHFYCFWEVCSDDLVIILGAEIGNRSLI